MHISRIMHPSCIHPSLDPVLTDCWPQVLHRLDFRDQLFADPTVLYRNCHDYSYHGKILRDRLAMGTFYSTSQLLNGLYTREDLHKVKN